MNRIIKSNQLPAGYLFTNQKNVVNNLNLNPTFDPKDKNWKLKKVLKTTTAVIPWLIEVNGEYFVAKQFFRQRADETVAIYSSTQKGKIENIKPVFEMEGYVDIETVVDIFAEKINKEKSSVESQEAITIS